MRREWAVDESYSEHSKFQSTSLSLLNGEKSEMVSYGGKARQSVAIIGLTWFSKKKHVDQTLHCK